MFDARRLCESIDVKNVQKYFSNVKNVKKVTKQKKNFRKS